MDEPYNFVKADIRRGMWEISELVGILDGIEYVIAGGYARYCMSELLHPKPTLDIDIFCKDLDTYDEIYKKLCRSKRYVSPSQSPFASTFYPKARGEYTINLVYPRQIWGARTTIAESIDGLLGGFPFTVTQAAIVSGNWTSGWVAPTFILDDYTNNIIIPPDVACPYSALRHAYKYVQRGWQLPEMSLRNAIVAIANMPIYYMDLVQNKKLDYNIVSVPSQSSQPF